MYYNKEDLDDELKCSICKREFDEPKLLPCTYHICSKCELIMCDKTQVSYECTLCKETHDTPKNGLPVSVIMKKLIQIQPLDLYRGDFYKNSREQFDLLKNSIKSFKEKYENIEITIKTHCEFMRHDVEIKTESNVVLLHKYREELISQIDAYEKECLKNSVESEKNKKHFHDFLIKTHEELNEWNMEFKSADLNDAKIESMTANMISLNDCLENKFKLLDRFVFNHKKMVFESDEEKQVKPEQIGNLFVNTSCLSIDRIANKCPNESFKYDEFDLNIRNFFITALLNDQYAITYETTNSNLKCYKLCLLNKNFKRIKTVNLIEYYSNSEVKMVGLTSTPKNIMIHIDMYSFFNGRESYSVLFDTKLNNKLRINQTHRPTSMVSDGINFYLKVNTDTYIYDNKNQLKKYDLAPINIQLKFKDNFIYTLTQNETEIKIISKQDGKLIKTIAITAPLCFDVISNECLITVEKNASNILNIYDLDGKFLKKITLNGVESISSMQIYKNYKVIINSEEQKTIHIYHI